MRELIKRSPSIHITVQQLEFIFDELQSRGFINITYTHNIKKSDIFQEVARIAALKPLVTRNLNVSNQKTAKKVIKATSTSKGDALTFSRLLIMIRKSLKHRGINLINQSSKEWSTLQQITSSATQFCNEFGLSITEGYKEYIQIGISKMDGAYSLLKFPRLHDYICKYWEAKKELEEHPLNQLAKDMLNRYKDIMFQKTQMDVSYIDSPDRAIAFSKAADLAKSIGVNAIDFIDAQFEALAFANGVPQPEQLYGDKARERVTRYMFETGKQANKHNTGRAIDLKKLKNIK